MLHEPEVALCTAVLPARLDDRRRGADLGLPEGVVTFNDAKGVEHWVNQLPGRVHADPDAEVRRLNHYVVERMHREVYASVKSVGFTTLVNKRMGRLATCTYGKGVIFHSHRGGPAALLLMRPCQRQPC